MVTLAPETPRLSAIQDLSRFSKLLRLVRGTAWVRRFIYNTRAKKKGLNKLKGGLSVDEVNKAEDEWIKDVQSELKDKGNYGQLVRKLGLLEDTDNLRCEGKLVESDLEIEAKETNLTSQRPQADQVSN